MRYTIDTEEKQLRVERDGATDTLDLYSAEGFAMLSRLWVTVGWSLKYTYQFSWLGRPIIQLPDDLVRVQELIYQVKPDVIIETGIAHGGGQVFFASLCRLLGKGRVIGIDIDIRAHARAALAAHELYPLMTLIESSSIDPGCAEQVRSLVKPGESVLVLLDSNHTKDHVLQELELYSPLVSVGSYIIVADGIMKDLAGYPRAKPEWDWDNPERAVAEFSAGHPEFEAVAPPRPFNEALCSESVTYWPSGYLRRMRP